MFSVEEVDIVTIPTDATDDIYTTLSAYSLCDKDGNTIYTGKDNKGNTVMYTQENNQKNAVTLDETTGKYKKNGVEIETSEKPLMAKIALKAKTVITGSMIATQDEFVTDDYREQTYNMISLPIDLITDEYVDIRLMLPNGLDYIVLSKQKVTIPEVAGAPLTDTVKLTLSEGDLLTLSSAIVEAYQIEGSKLYAIKYAEAGTQKAATETYVPTAKIKAQIENDPNIVDKAMVELKSRWTNKAITERNENINKAQREEENSKSKIEEHTTATQEARQQYLSALYGAEAGSESDS